MNPLTLYKADWPGLPLGAWQETYDTLHMWTQVVGKIRLALAPMINHWWQVTLYVSPRGLTTSPIPYRNRIFQMDFDFLSHQFDISTSRGDVRSFPLRAYSVAHFYQQTLDALHSLGIDVHIWTTPVEVAERIPFEADEQHHSYDPAAVERFWRILSQSDRILQQFRSRFTGKCSPVHFFWGGFDMSVTRFSGRLAPPHGPSKYVGHFVMLEGYSHEECSCGFWPGEGLGEPAYYSYIYPEPAGYREVPVQPAGAYFNTDLGEYILPYEAVRTAPSPDEALLAFAQSTYEAAANSAKWDRQALERQAQVSRGSPG